MSAYNELVSLLTHLLTRRFAPRPQYTRGLLGDGKGNVTVPERPDKSYVRFNRGSTEYFEVFNRTVNPVNDWPVLIGELPWQPGLTQVVDTDWAAFEQSGWGDILGSTSLHAPTHAWPDGSPGSDPLDIYLRSIVPLRTYSGGSGSTTIYLNAYEYEYQGSGHVWGGLPGLDLAPIIDSMITGTMRFMGVYLDPGTNTPDLVTGATTIFTSAFNPPRVQFPAGMLPSARVRIYGSQGGITEADIFDARQPFSPESSGGWPFDVKNLQTGVDYDTLMAAIAAAAAGDVLLVGAHLTEDVTVNKALTIKGLARVTITGTGTSADVILITSDAAGDVIIENLVVVTAYAGATATGIRSQADGTYKQYLRDLLITAYTGASNRIGIAVTSGDMDISDSYALSSGVGTTNKGLAVSTIGTVVNVYRGRFAGSTADVEAAASTTINLIDNPVLINDLASGAGTIRGQWKSAQGVTKYIEDPAPADGEVPIWSVANNRWEPGPQARGNVWPIAGESNIDATSYATIATLIAALASGVLGRVGEGSFTCDNQILPAGAMLEGSGVGVTTLTTSAQSIALRITDDNVVSKFSIINALSGSKYCFYRDSVNTATHQIREVSVVTSVAGTTNIGFYLSGANGTFNLYECLANITGGSSNNFAADFVNSIGNLYNCIFDAGKLYAYGTAIVKVYGGRFVDIEADQTSCTIHLYGPTVTGTLTKSNGGKIYGHYYDSNGVKVTLGSALGANVVGIADYFGGLCEFRGSLTSGTPVTTADVLAATNLYWQPYKGDRFSLYTNGRVELYYSAERTLSLSGLTANTNYDWYLYDNVGTLTAEFVAWTNDTTRATALVLSPKGGFLVKSGSTNKRYMGTIRITGTTGQCEDSLSKRFCWNFYNQAEKSVRSYNTNLNWNLTGATAAREFNNGSGQVRAEMVLGQAQFVRFAMNGYAGACQAGQWVDMRIGIDSVTTYTNPGIMEFIGDADLPYPYMLIGPAHCQAALSVGYHYATQIEASGGTATIDPGAGSTNQLIGMIKC